MPATRTSARPLRRPSGAQKQAPTRPRSAGPTSDPAITATLLDATMRLLGRGGLAAVTHRAVAKEAGMSLGSVTYRFLTIDSLLDAALRRFCTIELAQLETLASTLSGQSFDAEAWARAFAHALAHKVHAARDAELAGYELMLDAARRPRLRRPMRETGEAYRRVAELALAAAGSRAPSRHAHVLVAAITGLELHHLADPHADFEHVLVGALRALVVGLVASERSEVSERAAR